MNFAYLLSPAHTNGRVTGILGSYFTQFGDFPAVNYTKSHPKA